jgi:hypothetical protein
MVDIGRRSLAIAEAKRKRREERQAGLVERFGTTVIPLEAKGVRVPRFGTEPGVFDVRLRRFLTPREVVQRRVKQIVTKAKKEVGALKKEEIIELEKLQKTLRTITPTKKELKLRLKAPPTKAEKSVIAKGDELESKIKNLNKEVEEIEQTKTNLLNALDQAERRADITKTAQLRLEIDKLRGRIKDFEKRRVVVEADRQDFNKEIQREIAKTKTVKEIEEIEKKKKEPKKKTTFIEAAPTKKDIIEKTEIPFSGIVPTPEEVKKTIIETGKSFEEASKRFLGTDIFGVPKTIGFAAGGLGAIFEPAIKTVGFVAEQSLTAVERTTGTPTEIKIRVPSVTAKAVKGASNIPVLGEAFKVIQVSPVKGQKDTFELTLRKQFFVKGAQAAAEVELLTGFAGTRFAASAVKKLSSISKAGLASATPKVGVTKKIGALERAVAAERKKIITGTDVFGLPKRAGVLPSITEKVSAFQKQVTGVVSRPVKKILSKGERVRARAQQKIVEEIGVPLETARVSVAGKFERGFLKAVGKGERADFFLGKKLDPLALGLSKVQLQARLSGLRVQAGFIQAGRLVRLGARKAVFARELAKARGFTKLNQAIKQGAAPLTRASAKAQALAARGRARALLEVRTARAFAETGLLVGKERFVTPITKIAEQTAVQLKLAKLKTAAQFTKGKKQVKLFKQIKKIEAENILARAKLGFKEEIRLPVVSELRKFVVPLAKRKGFRITKKFIEKEARDKFVLQGRQRLIKKLKLKEVVPNIEETKFFEELAGKFRITKKELGKILKDVDVVSTTGEFRTPTGGKAVGLEIIRPRFLKKPTTIISIGVKKEIPAILKHEITHIVQDKLDFKKGFFRSVELAERQANFAEGLGRKRIGLGSRSIEEEILFFGRKRILEAKRKVTRPFARLEQEKQLAGLFTKATVTKITERGIKTIAPLAARIQVGLAAPVRRIGFELGTVKPFKEIKVPVLEGVKPKRVKPEKIVKRKLTAKEDIEEFLGVRQVSTPVPVSFAPSPSKFATPTSFGQFQKQFEQVAVRGRRGRRQIMLLEEEVGIPRLTPQAARIPERVRVSFPGIKTIFKEDVRLVDGLTPKIGSIEIAKQFEKAKTNFKEGIALKSISSIGSRFGDALKPASKASDLLKPASPTADALQLKSPQRILTRTTTRITTKTPTRTTEITRIKKPVKPKVPIPIPIILLGDKDAFGKEKKLVAGYDAFSLQDATKRAKWVKVTRQPRPLKQAEERGFKATDRTISQRAEVRKVKQKVPEEREPFFSVRNKFDLVNSSKKKKTFIEKRGFAIDTQGEKDKLKVTAFLAREKKKALGLPTKKTKGFKKSKSLQTRKRKGGFF